MGVHLVRLLAKNGIETVVTSRRKMSPEENISYIQGDAKDLKFLRVLLLEKWDAIVDFMVYTTADFDARIDEILASASQYIFISTGRVYADSQWPLTEASPRLLDCSDDLAFLSTDEYSLRKARQEDRLKRSGKSNWTIVRPYITYDKDRLQLGVLEKEEWLYRALHGRTIVFSRDIVAKMTTLTSGFDVANGIFSLIGNSKALTEIYNITSTQTIGWGEVLKIYVDALKGRLGYEPKVIFQDLPAFLQSKPAKYQIAYDRLYNRQFDCSKVAASTSVQDFMSPEAGLLRSIEAFLLNPNFSQIDWKLEAIRDKQCEEWASLREISGAKQKLKYLIFRLF